MARGSLGFLNANLIRGEDGYLLVDTGMNLPDSFSSLEQQLTELGVRLADIKTILVTHVHADHYGLAGKIRGLSGAEIVIHHEEMPFIEARYCDWEGMLSEMAAWLGTNGVPEQDLHRLSRASMSLRDYAHMVYPDRTMRGGEIIQAGEFQFEVIWTPGHSIGHMCFYERHKRILLSGDHVLPDITPIVSLHLQRLGNPLRDYINSLKAIGRLDVGIVLPAHQQIFYDLPKRVEELLQHHQIRMERIQEAIGDTPRTVCEIAERIPWRTTSADWKDLQDWEKRATVNETRAHLELMHVQKSVEKTCRRGLVYYGPDSGSQGG